MRPLPSCRLRCAGTLRLTPHIRRRPRSCPVHQPPLNQSCSPRQFLSSLGLGPCSQHLREGLDLRRRARRHVDEVVCSLAKETPGAERKSTGSLCCSPSCRVLQSCLPTNSSHSNQLRPTRLASTAGPDQPVFGPILDAISIQHHSMIDVGSRLVAGIENTCHKHAL